MKTLSLTARLLLWVVLAAWGLFALTLGAIHLVIVPRIDDARPALERWSSQALGVPVKVGTIQAQSVARAAGGLSRFLPELVPSFELRDVRLFDPAGREALRLPQVNVSISVRSLWRLGFEKLVIESPTLDVRRTADDRIEVAGLDFSGSPDQDSGAADWFFSQTEFAIHNGTLRWTDELRGQPPLALSDLALNLRNSRLHHDFRLDATPPAEWGDRLSLRGRLSEPLLDLSAVGFGAGGPPWRQWSGELYADFARVDVSRLQSYVDFAAWGVELRAGQGALRAWADLNKGQIGRVTTDLALTQFVTRLAPQLPELAIDRLNGRLNAQWSNAGFEVSTADLRFRTQEGVEWPGGALSLKHQRAQGASPASSALKAERVELATLAAIAARLPLPDASRALLLKLNPLGRVEGLKAEWQGSPPPSDGSEPANALAAAWQPHTYHAAGRVLGLALTGEPRALAPGETLALPGRPGLSGAQIDFDFNQGGGQAQLAIRQGTLELPGIFADPVVPLQRLDTQARWRIDGERIEAWFDKLSLANADTEGTASVHWTTSDPARSNARSRFPGVIDLTARLSRGTAERVHRYLPIAIGPLAQRYVQEAVRSGNVGQVDFRVQGDLYDVPYNLPGAKGQFRVTAQLQGVDFDYVPPYLQAEGDAPWPMLKGAKGQLVLDKASLKLTGLEAGLDGAPGVRLDRGEVAIADLVREPVVAVSSRAQGPASEVLGFVRASPINDLTSRALQQTTISGPAQLQFQLQLPLNEILKTTVNGAVQFTGNDVQISPASPMLQRTVGQLTFSERGFNIPKAQAQIYGGELRFEGGMAPNPQGNPSRIRFKGEGTTTAEGLRGADLGIVSRVAEQARGSAAYQAELAFRAGVPEISVTSDLQGMAVNLPAPLNKEAVTSLPLRYENKVLSAVADASGEVPRTDRLFLQLGNAGQPLVTANYERNITGVEPRVERGVVTVGLGVGELADMPAQGVQGNLRFRQVDADAWDQAFSQLTGVDPRDILNGRSNDQSAGLGYVPTRLAVRSDQLLWGARTYNNLLLGGSREGIQWRANVKADQLNGYLEYRPAAGNAAANVYARLANLTLPKSDTAEVEQLLQQPTSMPSLDIGVEDFELAGRKLGRVEIVAQNLGRAGRSREWRLTRLNLLTPEAQFSATGSWAFSPGSAADAARRTALDFELEIYDAGRLLARFDRAGVVRGGKGGITGSISWVGSPMSLDYASLSGQLNADIKSGQFLKVDPGAAKLLGVLSLQSLPRRLVLDFRDLFSEGFAFDFVRGDATIDQGVAHTNNLQMKGVNAAALMEGSADIAHEQQDLKVVVVPEINAGTAALIATVINPAVGLGTFLAQYLLGQPLQSAATQEFHITGQWADPQVEKVERKPPAPPARKPAPSGALQ